MLPRDALLVASLLAAVVVPTSAMGGHGGHGGMSGMGGMGSPDFLPDGLPVCIDGNYPLFKSEMASNMAQEGVINATSHAMMLSNFTLYMPDGAYPGKQMPMGMSSMSCPASSIDASAVMALPDTVFCVHGYYPLYKTMALAVAASPVNTSHPHAFDNFTLFMPNDVTMVHDTSCNAAYDDQSMALPMAGGHSMDDHHDESMMSLKGKEDNTIPIIIGFVVVIVAIALAIYMGYHSGAIKFGEKKTRATNVEASPTAAPTVSATSADAV